MTASGAQELVLNIGRQATAPTIAGLSVLLFFGGAGVYGALTGQVAGAPPWVAGSSVGYCWCRLCWSC